MENFDPFINDVPDIFHRMIQNWKNNNNFCSIGKVTAINASPVSVDVQPLIKHFDSIVKWIDCPELSEIPVAQLSNNLYSIKTPLNIGDIGIILWVDREIYTCLLAGGTLTTTPDTGNQSDFNACIFIPFIQSFSTANTIKQNGVDIVSNNQSLLQQLLTELSNITSLLTNLTTFATSVAASPTGDLSAYAGGVAAACSVLIASLVPLSTSIGNITTSLTAFKGGQ